MKITCILPLKFDIINHINKKYNKHYTWHDINNIRLGRNSFIVFMNDLDEYKIKYEINFD